jgi:EAL domain-containing protein (putative c-di-GMP-specific phosphodiesterase class I)
MHVDIIAEGIETEEQLLLLKDNGCNKIQGYYISKPKSKLEIFNMFNIPKSKKISKQH